MHRGEIPKVSILEILYTWLPTLRPRYIVTSVEDEWASIRKFTGNQLRLFAYRVKLSECYKVPTGVSSDIHNHTTEIDEQEEYTDTSTSEIHQQEPPVVEPPAEIVEPVDDENPQRQEADEMYSPSSTTTIEDTSAQGPSIAQEPRRSSQHKQSVFEGRLRDYVQWGRK